MASPRPFLRYTALLLDYPIPCRRSGRHPRPRCRRRRPSRAECFKATP